jgi:muskelin
MLLIRLLSFPGLLKPKGQKLSITDGTLRSTFWIYKPETLQWTQVLNAHSRTSDMESDETTTEWEPQPRYAHQMIYDHVRKVFYVHGGNSGRDGSCRLDDFWSMRFER